MRGVADLADAYGDGEIRITPGQNWLIPNVADSRLAELLDDPPLQEMPAYPSAVVRGTVSCTGIDYCYYSLIETKERAMETARALEKLAPATGPVSLFWSGCANGCANHTLADIGFVGKRVRMDGEILEAVDIYQRSAGVANGKPPAPVMTNVLCRNLPEVLARMLTESDAPAC